jgi:NAD(P)-dependent dehydrogenase (short-subunit alcohol dehydrogenase family)
MGLAIRNRLEETGCRVIGVDRPGHGAEVDADLSNSDGRQHAVAAVLAACGGGLDGLVCNAGVDVENIPLVFGVNYFGTVDLMEGLQPALARAPYAAAVLNVSNSIHITPNIPMEPVDALLAGDTAQAEALLQECPERAYQVSKFAVARWLRRNAPGAAWAGSAIRVNGICPGPVLTDLLKKDLNNPEKRGPILSLPQPLGDFATPESVGNLAEFLLSEQARYLVGQLIMIDGGVEALFRAEDVPVVWRR